MPPETKAAPAQAVTVESVAAEVTKIQKEAAIKDQPLTGVEIAAKIADALPDAPSEGTKYRIAEIKNAPVGEPLTAENSVVVKSQDGSIEDAVRTFNFDKKEIRTAKQLRIEKCPAA